MKRKIIKPQGSLLQIWLLLAVAMLPGVAQAQFQFTTNNDGSLNLYQYTGSGGDVIIPDTTNDLPVTSIGDDAFSYCSTLTNVTIGANVTSIGDWAFYDCSSLTNVMIGTGVTSIGGNAFTYCTSLTGITIPNGVTNIGTGAFQNTSLTGMMIPNSVTAIGDWAFSYCPGLASVTIPDSITNIGVGVFYASGLASVTIPNSVTNIGDYAFEHCGNLISVTIPNSVITIENEAFAYCNNLAGVTMSSGVTSIGANVFADCTSLAGITIPNSVTSIGSGAFSYCSNLTSIYFEGNAPTPTNNSSVFSSDSRLTVCYQLGTTGWGATFDGRPTVPAFLQTPFIYTTNNGALSIVAYVGPGGTVVIPDTINGLPVKSIGSNAFYYCTSMTSVTIPNNVTNIGRNAFYDCYNMTGVYFEGNAPISAYDSSVFSSDNAVIVYYLPGTTGWDRSFDGKITGLWSQIVPYNFTISNSAITITAYTGSGGGVVIPDTIYNLPVTSIGQSAFANCTSLTSVTIPASVTSIGDEAFYGCDGLTNVTIPASVTGLGHGAFAFCGSLTSVAIPDSVTNLGEYAFYSCGSLASATISTNVTSIAISAFDSCTGLTNVTIPNGVTNIGSSAFQNCASLGGVFIPTSVTNIGLYAFDSCGGLTAITVDPQNMNYSSADGVLFNPGQSTLIQCPGGKAGCYVISNTVTNIGNIAFDSCAGLTSVVIPFSVKSIGDWAFDSCTGLTILKIPNSATNIGCSAFDSCSGLTSISIQPFPAVDNSYSGGAAVIRDHTFEACTSLMSVTIGPWVTTIMSYAFDGCTNVTGFYFQYNAPLLYYTSVFSNDINATVYYEPWRTGWDSTFGGLPTAQWLNPNGFTFTTNNGAITITGYTASGYDDLIIPDTTNGLPVTSIGEQAFYRCEGLTSITIPNTVTSIGSAAFYSCTRLTSVYCLGNSPVPTDDSSVFLYDSSPTVYYLPGTTGWGATFDGVPTASWMLPNPTILNFEPNFGIQTNQFGFTVSWATNIPVVVEACTDLANPVWFPVGTNMLTGGSSYFTDSQWTNYPSRFYRLRSP